MRDAVRLVMEETGCDEGQAIVALESCNYNVQKSISKIFDLLRDIVVLKGKFRTSDNNLYGMLTITTDIKHNRLLRTKILVTYNPSIYETDIDQNWYEYEKKLYTARLISGSIPDITLQSENLISGKLGVEYRDSFFKAVKDNNIVEIVDLLKDILMSSITAGSINFVIATEHLNMSQFRKISELGRQQMEFNFVNYNLNMPNPLSIEVVPLTEGRPSILASSLIPGDEIFVYVSDCRDIAQYISGLLGGKSPHSNIPIPSKIQEVYREKEGIRIMVRMAIGVIGVTIVPEKMPIKICTLVRGRGIINYVQLKFYLIFSEIFEKIKRLNKNML